MIRMPHLTSKEKRRGHWRPQRLVLWKWRVSGVASLLHALLDGVLYVFDFVELDVAQFVADPLDAADVNRLHHIARFRIDAHGAAGAHPAHAFGGRN